MGPPILIVAYGNPLRCDDGIAWRAADELERTLSQQNVEILRLHQLTPEIADAIRDRELVLFVDAACLEGNQHGHPGDVRVTEIGKEAAEKNPPGQFSHFYSPAHVLGAARELFGASPKAFVITVTGEDFGHGEHLSNAVANALPELLATIRGIIEPV